MISTNRLAVALIAVAAVTGSAARPDPIDKIREADLKRDLFALAGDAMRRREGGTLDEMAASALVGERARERRLLHGRHNGTYFHLFLLELPRLFASSPLTLD